MDARKGMRRAYFGKDGMHDCPVFDRYRLGAGHAHKGAAFVEERETTTLIGRILSRGPRRVIVGGNIGRAIIQELDLPRPLVAGWFAASAAGCLFSSPEGEPTYRYIEVGTES